MSSSQILEQVSLEYHKATFRHQLTVNQVPPPSLREILGAYKSRGDGDRDMLIAMLNAKSAEDQARLFSFSSGLLLTPFFVYSDLHLLPPCTEPSLRCLQQMLGMQASHRPPILYQPLTQNMDNIQVTCPAGVYPLNRYL